MPNYCRCNIELNGENISLEDFERIVLAIKSDRLCEEVIPYEGSSPSCNWAEENWGTKWGTFDTSIHCIKQKTIKAHFSTAWNPPWFIFRKLAEKGWEFKVKYLDESWNFVGQITHKTSNSLAVYEEWQTSRPWFLKQQLKLSGVGSKLINRKQLWKFGCIEQWMSAQEFKPSREERNRPLEEGIKVYRVQRSVLEKKKKVKTKLQKLDQTGG